MINANCSICDNQSRYDKESLKGSTWEINGIPDIVLCCPCEDELLHKLAKSRGIELEYSEEDSGEIVSITIKDKTIQVK